MEEIMNNNEVMEEVVEATVPAVKELQENAIHQLATTVDAEKTGPIVKAIGVGCSIVLIIAAKKATKSIKTRIRNGIKGIVKECITEMNAGQESAATDNTDETDVSEETAKKEDE